ncbi:MAG: hypothetical protein M1381_10245 [Deltaproteobacteria bacterium]|nr:hypothetical protein [Deltaproteobacteria bacterium]MCL5791649.1 hypothetical protein [Deltaproteobacteria bacterium]
MKKLLFMTSALILILAITSCNKVLSSNKDRLKFSHKLHISNGIDCLTCHSGIEKAKNVSTSFIPEMSVCFQCHSDAQNKCSMCHTNPDKAQPFKVEKKDIVFAHDEHIPRVKNDCTYCHTRIPFETEPTPGNLPTMQVCMTCHQKDYDSLKCSMCHTELSSISIKRLAKFSHNAGFKYNHGALARTDIQSCEQCHQLSFCDTCHNTQDKILPAIRYPEAPQKALIHRGDWLAVHSIEAQQDPASCYRCHTADSCRACHIRNGVGADTSSPVAAPHPTGTDFLFNTASSQFHGRLARQNINTCASCHSGGTDSICVQCHKVGGVGGNPHPANFKSSLNQNKDAVCVICHGQ